MNVASVESRSMRQTCIIHDDEARTWFRASQKPSIGAQSCRDTTTGICSRSIQQSLASSKHRSLSDISPVEPGRALSPGVSQLIASLPSVSLGHPFQSGSMAETYRGNSDPEFLRTPTLGHSSIPLDGADGI